MSSLLVGRSATYSGHKVKIVSVGFDPNPRELRFSWIVMVEFDECVDFSDGGRFYTCSLVMLDGISNINEGSAANV